MFLSGLANSSATLQDSAAHLAQNKKADAAGGDVRSGACFCIPTLLTSRFMINCRVGISTPRLQVQARLELAGKLGDGPRSALRRMSDVTSAIFAILSA